MSNYVDENRPGGLKQNSRTVLGYEQADYASVTTITAPIGQFPYPGGRIIADNAQAATKTRDAIPATEQTRVFRMNELPAQHVLAYGADDTICTAALFNHFSILMEIEDTLSVYEEVEVKPAYLTALGFVTGADVSIERLKQLEREDDRKYEAARVKLAETLERSGVINKLWKPYTELTAATAKDAFEELVGFRPESKARNLDKLAAAITAEVPEDLYASQPWITDLIGAIEAGDLRYVNGLLMAKYRNNPVIDIGSPKQMREFLYDTLKLPIRVLNKVTPLERQHNRDLARAVTKFNKAAMEGVEPQLDPTEWELVRAKAKTNEVAVQFALAMDATGDARDILEAMMAMKKITTRRNFYYYKYPPLKHWKDGKIHSSMNQCATVTRRYSSSGPNLQQLPKKGEGVKIREMIVPHHRNAVVVSLDFSGQELRLAADMSGDEAMLACYIGDRLKDIHSITASGAMEKKWGRAKLDEMVALIKAEAPRTADDLYDVFTKLRKHEDEAIAKMADDLRKVAKNVNFGAQYDAQALTLSYQLIIPVQDAQSFLDAREKMFPGVSVWKDEVRERVMRTGYAKTYLGGRRHLAALMADNATANKAGRQGPNFEVQGSAAEMTKLAAGRIWDSGVCFDYDCRFIAPVHDEFVFSIAVDDLIPALTIIHREMTMPYATMKVPVVSEISIGPNFGQQWEVGSTVDPVKIEKALAEIFAQAEAA
jgi:DNA polymerase I-like protein with 3'-5' exonuclease and polymerase domains